LWLTGAHEFSLCIGGFFTLNHLVSVIGLIFFIFDFPCRSLTSGIRALVIRFGVGMSSKKYDLPLLDWDTRFSLWQAKMRAVLSQTDLDDALDGFRKNDVKTWTDEEKCKNRKALSHIHLHLSNNILQEVLAEKTATTLWLKLESICMSKDLTNKMHMKMKLFTHKLQE
jgi:hypothetical protein